MKRFLQASGTFIILFNMLISISLTGLAQNIVKPVTQKVKQVQSQGKINHPPQHMDNGFFKIQREFNEYWAPYNVDNNGYYVENGVKKKAGGWKQFKRWEWFWENRIDPITGEFPIVSAADIYEQQGGAGSRSLDGNWTSLGPSSSSGGYAGIGRINCVVEQPVTGDLYAGSPSGGLWKSTDGGSSWTVLTDNNAVLGVSAIVVVPTGGADIIYIGTGDRDGGSMWSLNGDQSNDNNSVGVLKSVDGGATWLPTGLTYSTSQKRTINKLIIDPNDSNIIYAATSVGIYKTTNAGINWTQQASGSNFIDMEMHPTNSSILYSSTKTYYNSPVIYKTSNGGSSWSSVATMATTDYRIDIAVTPANSAFVYAVVAKQNGGLSSIQKSTNTGASFSQVFGSGTNMLGWYCLGTDATGQGGYDLCIAADPSNANTVYVGGVNTWKSTTGGTSWSNNNMWTSSGTYNSCGSPVAHADKHDLVFFGSTLYECNDGGLYKTTNGGSTWSDISNGMITSQIYRLSVAQTTPNEVMTGLQDNGSKLLWTGTWYDVQGGDGMECLIDYQDINDQYGTYPRGTIMRTTAHWSGTETEVTPGSAGDGAWVTPFVIDPNNHLTLFAGYSDIWKSANQGTSWTKISTINDSDYFRSLAVAPSNSNYIYAAGRDILYKTVIGGTTWTNITGTLPVGSSYITYVSVKADDPNTVWVSMGEYNSYGVYETTNGGSTWTNISSGLPNIPVMCVIQNKLNTTETELYAGTDLGVYAKVGSGDWFSFNNGLPNVVVTELEIYYDNTTPTNSRLRAATFGRGLWESDLFTAATTPPSISNVSPSSLYEDRGKQLTITGSDLGGSIFVLDGISGSIVSNNGSTAVIDFPAANYSNGTLTVTNAAGNDTWSVTVSKRNTIPVDASTGSNTDIHQTIDGAVDGLAAWYGSTGFNSGDLPGTKTIEVSNGTYNESVTLNSNLNPTATNKLVIIPATGASPVVNAGSQSYGFNLSTVDNVELNGFTIYNATFDNIYAQGDNVTIKFNRCYGATGGSGIRVQNGTPFVITNNLCYGNYKYGIHLNNSNNVLVKNNTTDDNGGTYIPATGVALYSYDFESGDYTGWTTTGGWGIYNDANYAHSPTHMAGMTNSSSGQLTYSSIDISGYDNLSISAYVRSLAANMDNTDLIRGYYSFDNSTWVQLFYIFNDYNTYASCSASGISTSGCTKSTLFIRFTATCNLNEYWFVDDITVTGDEAGTATNTGAGLCVESGTGSSIQNNIFNAKAGNNAYYALITESGITVNSNYNTYYTTNTNLFDYNGTVGNTGPLGASDLITNPLFVSGSDYHIFSTNGSYHGGEWPPLTASGGTWTNDASNSPAIDAGNPADASSNEPVSGNRINQGAYGNTVQASKTGVTVTVFAGADATICEGDTYAISDATASSYTSLSWTTSGDGSFDDDTALNPVYTPGTTDISSSIVTLSLTGQPGDVSDEMILTITSAPVITSQPSSSTVCEGDNTSFSLTATGASTYQWQYNGTDIGGATASILDLTNITTA
ncbi:MAG: hypothetical protein C0591_14795, partial [Marinilabiliales bacterium]